MAYRGTCVAFAPGATRQARGAARGTLGRAARTARPAALCAAGAKAGAAEERATPGTPVARHRAQRRAAARVGGGRGGPQTHKPSEPTRDVGNDGDGTKTTHTGTRSRRRTEKQEKTKPASAPPCLRTVAGSARRHLGTEARRARVRRRLRRVVRDEALAAPQGYSCSVGCWAASPRLYYSRSSTRGSWPNMRAAASSRAWLSATFAGSASGNIIVTILSGVWASGSPADADARVGGGKHGRRGRRAGRRDHERQPAYRLAAVFLLVGGFVIMTTWNENYGDTKQSWADGLRRVAHGVAPVGAGPPRTTRGPGLLVLRGGHVRLCV